MYLSECRLRPIVYRFFPSLLLDDTFHFGIYQFGIFNLITCGKINDAKEAQVQRSAKFEPWAAYARYADPMPS